MANGQQIGINSTTRREWRFSREAQWLYNAARAVYNDKMRILNHADELLTASSGYVNEPAKHGNYDQFARGVVDFRVGGRGYTADVIVGINKLKRAFLYDIVNIQSKNIADASYNQQGQGPARSNASANISITDSETDVNENLPARFSLKNADEAITRLAQYREKYGTLPRGEGRPGCSVPAADGRLHTGQPLLKDGS